jgi:hypothetical protein
MYTPKTSDEAVDKATGKKWNEWFAILDRAGAKKMPHREIVQVTALRLRSLRRPERPLRASRMAGHSTGANSKDGLPRAPVEWWSQMVTVEYERSRRLRVVNQTSTGFNVSVHGTFAMPVSKLFTAWQRIAKKNGLVESTVHKNKTIRYKTEKGKPLHVVAFASKGPGKSRIGFEVMRLAKPSEVEQYRAKWKKVLAKIT